VRLLVTGGAGYLGSEVCRQALARGVDVVAAQLHTPAPYGRAIALDVRDEDAVQRAFIRCGPDVVVHTAYVQSGPALFDTVVRGTRAVAEAAGRLGARLVHISTDLVFDGEAAPYTEADEPRPVNAYGAAKAEAERFVRDGLIVRTSLQYGKSEPGQQELLALRDDVEFYVDEIRCPTLVGETAAALLDLVELDVTGPLHVCAREALSRYEFARLLRGGEVRGAPVPPGRPRNVALDPSRFEALLGRSLRGASGALSGRA
jgi:dTDP-4-dehydrorhamnose reductase